MAIKTYTEQLEEVQAAISELLAAGQAVSARDAMKQRAQLAALTDREKYLRPLAERENRGGGIRIVQAVPRG